MKRLIISILAMGTLLSMVGCVYQPYYPQSQSAYQQKIYSVDSLRANYSDPSVDVTLSPKMSGDRYSYFTLTIANKSKNDLKLSWNDTYFLENNAANGGFMFEGIQYAQRNAPKQDSLILANTTMTIDIYPNIKVEFYKMWFHNTLENGNFGAYIALSGKNYDKKIQVHVGLWHGGLSTADSGDTPDQYYLAQDAFQQEKFAEAAAHYDAIINRYPDNAVAPLAYLRQAICFSKLGQTVAAKTRMQELIQNHPNSKEAAQAKEFLASKK